MMIDRAPFAAVCQTGQSAYWTLPKMLHRTSFQGSPRGTPSPRKEPSEKAGGKSPAGALLKFQIDLLATPLFPGQPPEPGQKQKARLGPPTAILILSWWQEPLFRRSVCQASRRESQEQRFALAEECHRPLLPQPPSGDAFQRNQTSQGSFLGTRITLSHIFRLHCKL